MTNLNSMTELTKFTPLSPEPKQSSVVSLFSKLFKSSSDNSSSKRYSTSNASVKSSSQNDSPNTDSAEAVINTSKDIDSVVTIHQHLTKPIEARNLPNVLRRVSSLLALRNKSSAAYNDTRLKQYWMPDSVSKECYDCGEKFTTFRRRHHCRVCGQIFCSQCCGQVVPGKIVGCSGNLRVCTYCCKVVLSYLQDSDLSVDLKALQDDLLSKFGEGVLPYEDYQSQDTLNTKTGSNTSAETNKRKMSLVYQEEKFAVSRSPDFTTWHVDGNRKSELASLNTLLHELTSEDKGLRLQTYITDGTKHEDCFMGSQLIDWLIYQKKTFSRTHSIAMGQILLDANYIESLTEKSEDFLDSPSLYKFCAISLNTNDDPDVITHHDKPFCMSENTSTVSHSDFQLDINISKNTAHISRQPQKVNYTKDKKRISIPQRNDFLDEIINDFIAKYVRLGQIVPTQWSSINVKKLQEKNNEASTFQSLSDAFQQHLQNAVNQLLALENLSLSWFSIIVPLVEQALREIKLDFNKTDVFHIGHYVQIKKLPGGERKDSCFVGGVVYSKNVAHREMSTYLTNPRILLLQCAVVYQRVEGRLLSLEPVIMQEQEYLRHVVARIAALRPDIILAHRSVSRLAQESLNADGVTLVLNVKMSVMERIARCTNADIVTSVDAHIGTTHLGSCRSFCTKEFTLKDGRTKTLMFFEGCAFPQFGCTILLRGASIVELRKLKKVTNSVLFMYYNAKLEKSFLMDEFAKPPTVPSFTFIGDTTKRAVVISSRTGKRSENESMSQADEINKNNRITTKLESEIEIVKGECYRKSESEDKRTSNKSIVDFDDPLRLKASSDNDKISTSETAELTNNLPFTEIPLKENNFRIALEDTVLSYSPFIEFNLPYLETKTGRNCELRKYFPPEIYYSSHLRRQKDSGRATSSDAVILRKRADLYHIVAKKDVHPFVTTRLKNNVMNEEIQTLLALYRACGGRLEPVNEYKKISCQKSFSNGNVKQQEIDFMDPQNHQKLSVLFCSFSHVSSNSPEFCVNPWIVNMDFYGCNDIPLGSFLEKYCFRTSYMCPSATCETPMLEHERRFVHDTGCVHITLNIVDSLPDESNLPILLWSVCTVCKVTTPIVAISSDSWNLSFAKYLELRFHASKYTSRADSGKSCNHSFHHDYCQYFYRKNIIASFKYTDILRWEVSLPPLILTIESTKLHISPVVDEIKKWAVMGHEVFSSILEKLCLFDADINTLQGLKKYLSKEQAEFKKEVDEIQVILTCPSFTEEDIKESSKELYNLQDKITTLKQKVAKTLFSWNPLLMKLDSRKRDDKPKNKSLTNDIMENISPPVICSDGLSTYSDETINSREHKDEQFCSEESDNPDSASEASKCEFGDIKLCDKFDGNINQLNLTSTENLNATVSQSSNPDRITVKTLLSQLLPNTFQNNASILFNPINTEEHYLLGRSCSIPIVVYESEPSSVISYALSTHYYQSALENIVKGTSVSSEQTYKNNFTKRESTDGVSLTSVIDSPQISETEDVFKYEGSEESKARSNKHADLNHIDINFSDSTANFTVKVYFAHQFREIRNLIFPAGEEVFIRSLSRCVQWVAHGGKSGSSFSKTRDDRFILKDMARLEISSFLEFAPHYFNFIRACHTSQQPTLLVKFAGAYYVKYRNIISNQTFHSNLLVMENLFYTRDIIRKFDLKGSVRNRLVNPKNIHGAEMVLLDENLINMTCVSPLYIYPHSKTILIQAISRDAAFLASQCVMDYSLLVGLDETSQELVVGIIDYIRTFTWDKKLETMVKKSGLLGGQGKLPTIVSPEEYKSRFVAAMHKYFLAVPDQWMGFGKGIDY